jgi:lysophospholipid acyltransferase (LPLAT)-like uncharacterized protein
MNTVVAGGGTDARPSTGYLPAMELGPPRHRLLGWALALGVRLLASTWRVRWRDRAVLRAALDTGRVILAFFHEDQLPLVALHRRLGIAGMASLSADGTLLAEVIARLGYDVIRGSTSRGAVAAALCAARRLATGGSVALAVDGPRGPRRQAQAGVLTLAATSGAPIVLLAVRAYPALRLHTWDRFLLPLPFARVEVRYAGCEPVPRGRGRRAEALRALTARMAVLAGE